LEPTSPRPEGELARRDAYLAAIADLGGEEEGAGEVRRKDGDERTRPLLDLQGRKLRGRMHELGLTIGELGEKSDIDTVSPFSRFAETPPRAGFRRFGVGRTGGG
jgi:hypothetical protein